MRALIRIAGPFVLLTLGACGGRAHPTATPPVEPDASVRAFMNAVQANSFVAMGELFGSSKGPAARWMNRQELEQRLTVMRAYLVNEKFEIQPPRASRPQAPGERSLEVTLDRKGCSSVVPFTLVAFQGGWLVKAVDLQAAGTPPRERCGPGSGQSSPRR